MVRDTKLINEISASSSLEDFALSTLGLSREDLLLLNLQKKDKREYIRRVIADSQPSFGKFMTQVYKYYQGLQEIKGKTTPKTDTKKVLLKEMRTLINTPLQEPNDLLHLVYLTYKYSRLAETN